MTQFLDHWYDHQNLHTKENKKNIYLTFDDGFLDNWVFVYPIAKKYNLKITLFVNPEFVLNKEAIRPTIEAVWDNKLDIKSLKILGHLSWGELKEMYSSGLVDIQSHSMSHTWFPCDNLIVDILTNMNRQRYPWIFWNHHPALKPEYLDEFDKNIIAPMPIFKNGRSLGIRRYFPNDEIYKIISKYLSSQAESASDRHMLENLNSKFYQERLFGRFETDNEMFDRYYFELNESKKILGKKLNKEVKYLCWPGGAYNPFSVWMSKRVGYKASTIGSWDTKCDTNNFKKKYKRIQRIGISASIIGLNNRYIPQKFNVALYGFKSKTSKKFFRFRSKLERLKYIGWDLLLDAKNRFIKNSE